MSDDLKNLTDSFLEPLTNIETTPAEVIPDKCIECKNNTICSPLTSHINLLTIGIKIQIEECQFFSKYDKPI